MSKCLFTKCRNAAKCRGLCLTHYSTANRLVKIGRVTWKQLENNHKCTRAGAKYRSSHWFLTPDQNHEKIDPLTKELADEILRDGISPKESARRKQAIIDKMNARDGLTGTTT